MLKRSTPKMLSQEALINTPKESHQEAPLIHKKLSIDPQKG
jgi:hypothetical protein